MLEQELSCSTRNKRKNKIKRILREIKMMNVFSYFCYVIQVCVTLFNEQSITYERNLEQYLLMLIVIVRYKAHGWLMCIYTMDGVSYSK